MLVPRKVIGPDQERPLPVGHRLSVVVETDEEGHLFGSFGERLVPVVDTVGRHRLHETAVRVRIRLEGDHVGDPELCRRTTRRSRVLRACFDEPVDFSGFDQREEELDQRQDRRIARWLRQTIEREEPCDRAIDDTGRLADPILI